MRNDVERYFSKISIGDNVVSDFSGRHGKVEAKYANHILIRYNGSKEQVRIEPATAVIQWRIANL